MVFTIRGKRSKSCERINLAAERSLKVHFTAERKQAQLSERTRVWTAPLIDKDQFIRQQQDLSILLPWIQGLRLGGRRSGKVFLGVPSGHLT